MGCNAVKRLLVVICSIIIWMTPGFCHAEVMENYTNAHNIYMAAGACAAAYSDRIGEVANRYLEQDGWKIDRYVQTQGRAGARFLLAKNDFGDGKQTYILAFVGTETSDDINFDLQVDKVYFAGNTLEEFTANATKEGVPNTSPKVHKGFLEFVESGLKAKTIDANGLSLADMLLTNKDCRVYLVGHSLGGAAATLAGAGLISMGVNPEQIEVITFGAPAVGNAAFVAQYNKVLKLTRIVISGDLVTGILQSLVGGYKQFGKEIRWEIPDSRDQTHNITEYMDVSLKNYYDKRQQVLQAGIKLPRPIVTGYESGQAVYITPFKNSLPEALAKEFWYMREAVWDEYREKLPGCTLAKEGDMDDWRKIPISSGYRWVVVPEVSVTQLKQERNIYYITVTQTVYEVATGAIVETASFSTATYNLTPLEAVIHDLKDLNNSKGAWILKVK